MAFTRQSGSQMAPRGSKVGQSKEEANRAKSIAMARMKRSGRSLRDIGDFFGMSYEGVRKRINAIPSEVLHAQA